MERTQQIEMTATDEELRSKLSLGHLYYIPYQQNQYVYMITAKRALKVVVTDVSMTSIQLNGQWYTWEEIDEKGGVFEAEFDALTAIAQMM